MADRNTTLRGNPMPLQGNALAAGQKAPDFTLTGIDMKPVTLAETAGCRNAAASSAKPLLIGEMRQPGSPCGFVFFLGLAEDTPVSGTMRFRAPAILAPAPPSSEGPVDDWPAMPSPRAASSAAISRSASSQCTACWFCGLPARSHNSYAFARTLSSLSAISETPIGAGPSAARTI